MPSGSTSDPRQVSVAWERLSGWIERYQARHAGSLIDVRPDTVSGQSPDGSRFAFDVPLGPLDELTLDGLGRHVQRPWVIGIVLVRKGGFAVARLVGPDVAESKVGRRHVQSRSKAGGWSQQRFARRRDNQARAAYDAASGYVRDILLPYARGIDLLVTGGDKGAVDTVLEDRVLVPLASTTRHWIPGLPDPKAQVLDAAVAQARSVEVEILDDEDALGAHSRRTNRPVGAH